MSIFPFFLPGILLIFYGTFNKKGMTEFLAYAVGLSLSFYAVFPLLTGLLHFSLLGFVYLALIFSSLLLLVEHGKVRVRADFLDRHEMVVAVVMLASVVLRFAPMLFQAAPSGGLISSMAYAARSIVDGDGIPRSLFSLRIGFPAISAVMSLLNGAPAYRTCFMMTCASFGLLSVGLYVLLRNFFEKRTAAFSAIAACFLLLNPQELIASSGGPTMLASFLLILSLSLVIEFKDGFHKEGLIVAFIFLAASFLIEPVFLFPERFSFLLWTLPLSFLVAPGISKIIPLKNKKIFAALLTAGLVVYAVYYVHVSLSSCPVAKQDLEVFKWIDKVVGKKAVFANNSGDLGIWIPAMTGRAITSPADSSHESRLVPAYIYIGSKAIGDIEYAAEDMQARPSRYRLVFIKDGAQVWKIL